MTYNLSENNHFQHNHDFQPDYTAGERRTLIVVILTGTMMVVEIATGMVFGSLALLADGWHMGTHTFALGVAFAAYWYARRKRNDPRFSFGTGKITALGGYTSAVLLFVVAAAMAIESFDRLLHPQSIRFEEAIWVAGIGLIVNLISARILGTTEHHHHHDENHDHGGHTHDDHNLRAAYLHVLADAFTSILAIVALLSGRFFGWVWMDALMGIVGALVISRWSLGLLRDTAQALVNRADTSHLEKEIRRQIEDESDVFICDLHLWEISENRYACILSLQTPSPRPPNYYKEKLAHFSELAHITIEVQEAEDNIRIPA